MESIKSHSNTRIGSVTRVTSSLVFLLLKLNEIRCLYPLLAQDCQLGCSALHTRITRTSSLFCDKFFYFDKFKPVNVWLEECPGPYQVVSQWSALRGQ